MFLTNQLMYLSAILVAAVFLSLWTLVKSKPKPVASEDDPNLTELVSYIYQGCKLYVHRQLKVVSLFIIGIFLPFMLLSVVLGIGKMFLLVFVIVGGLSSGVIGYVSVKLTINAIYQFAALNGSSFEDLFYKYRSSGVYITVVLVGITLLDLFIWFAGVHFLASQNIFGFGEYLMSVFLNSPWSEQALQDPNILSQFHIVMLKFMGAYTLGFGLRTYLTRIKGGIFSASADITADFVGATEFDLPEDDLRNPLCISDQVGDQVKDSFSFSLHVLSVILFATVIVAVIGAMNSITDPHHNSSTLVVAPFLALAISLIALILTPMIHKKKLQSIDHLFKQNLIHVVITLFIIIVLGYGMVVYGFVAPDSWRSFLIGVVCFILFAGVTTNLTLITRKPVQRLAKKCELGAMTTVLDGLSIGFFAVLGLLLILVAGLTVTFFLTGRALHILHDFYNVGFFSLGLLCGGIHLFPEAIGLSSVDNVKGCNDMLSKGDDLSRPFKQLEVLGTSAMAFMNNVLGVVTLISGLIFIFFYVMDIRNILVHHVSSNTWIPQELEMIKGFYQALEHHQLDLNQLSIKDIFDIFEIHLLNPKLMIGVIIGTLVIVLAIALIVRAIGNNVSGLTKIMRKEFAENKGIYTGESLPDYEQGLAFAMNASQRWMFMICGAIIVTPFVVSVLYGIPGVVGFFMGSTIVAILFSLLFNMSGACWKNARLLIELNDPQYYGTNKHISATVGCMLGDMFRDGLAPSLIIIVQILSFFCIVLAAVALRTSSLIQL